MDGNRYEHYRPSTPTPLNKWFCGGYNFHPQRQSKPLVPMGTNGFNFLPAENSISTQFPLFNGDGVLLLLIMTAASGQWLTVIFLVVWTFGAASITIFHEMLAILNELIGILKDKVIVAIAENPYESCEGWPHKNKCTKAKGNRRMQVSKTFIEKRQKSYENITTK